MTESTVKSGTNVVDRKWQKHRGNSNLKLKLVSLACGINRFFYEPSAFFRILGYVWSRVCHLETRVNWSIPPECQLDVNS